MLPPRFSFGAFLVAVSLLSAACGGGGAPATPTSEPTAAASPSLTSTASATGTVEADKVIDLAEQEALLTVIGADIGDFESDLGAVATGDFNGDGLADVIAGARFGDGPDNAREDAGEAYIILGSSHAPAVLDLATDQADVTIWGEGPGDALGLFVAAADLDGDGFDDILLGAPFAKFGAVEGGQPGKAYVIYGNAELPATIDVAQDGADVELIGATSQAFFGDSLAAGDVNDDGSADLIVGATFEGHRPTGAGLLRAGAAYVIYGGERWPARLEMAAGDFDAAVYGAEEFDELGDNVTSGDLNDDGYADVMITAEAADGPDNTRPVAAEVDGVFGSKSLKKTTFLGAGEGDISVTGAETQDTLGFSIAAGDFNNDGIDDVAMGARLANGPEDQRNSAGEVWVLFGSRSLPSVIDLAEPPAGLAVYYGADGSDFLGGSVAAGDLDGDGTTELIMGAPFGDGPANSRGGAGEVYVVAGAEPQVKASVDGAHLAGLVFGALEGDKFGAAVAAGDFDGDGRDELVVAATEADGPGRQRPDVGRVYVMSLAP